VTKEEQALEAKREQEKLTKDERKRREDFRRKQQAATIIQRAWRK
jgi:hypothetical protein